MAARKKIARKRPAAPKAVKRPTPRKAARRKVAPKRVARRSLALKSRQQPETLRLRSASPSFTVNDVERSLAFYCDVLGFFPGQRWEEDGRLLGVELRAGSVSFYVGQDD
jgi:hypothetical protein